MIQASQVFISYDQEDGKFAHQLAIDLKELGVRVWIAPESIRAGEGWVEAINRGLEESDYMLAALTPEAVDSKWVRKEVEVAVALEREGRLRLIPLDVEPCEVPSLWSTYQMIDFRQDYDAGLGKLAAVLGRSAGRGETKPQSQDGLEWANGKRCPKCGKDIGTMSIIKALSPNRITCPHCATLIGYQVRYGALIALALLALPLMIIGAYALYLDNMGIFVMALIIAFIIELLWGSYLRSKKQLRVMRNRR